jgi:uncharacterized protein YecE (DUF72 family)
MPKEATHERRLEDCTEVICRFATEANGLGRKFGVLLVQLPPSLPFAADHRSFFSILRDVLDAAIVCEPHHTSWFRPEVDEWLSDLRISRVAGDPASSASADLIGGFARTAYFRLHGSRRTFYSSYSEDALANWTKRVLSCALRMNEAWSFSTTRPVAPRR